jgi:hypothetical protein
MTNILLLMGGFIPTNTPAFQSYAYDLALSQAAYFSTNWNLELPFPLPTNLITMFGARPKPDGASVGVVFGDRYAFSVDDQKMFSFTDKHFYSASFVGKDDKKDELIRMTNLLTLATAVEVARKALQKIGIATNEALIGPDPVRAVQWRYDRDGEVFQLPLYDIRWHSDQGTVQFEISGVTSNVARFYHITRTSKLWVDRPTNYMEMLELPTNANFVTWQEQQRLKLSGQQEDK